MTITYTKRIGNIFVDKKSGSHDTVSVTRADMHENHQTVKTKGGRNAEIRLRKSMMPLEHGDILEGMDAMAGYAQRQLVVKQEPEMVILAKFLAWDPTDNYDLYCNLTYDAPMQVGHILGQMQKPLSIRKNGDSVSFPIELDSELDAFVEKLRYVSGDVEAEIIQEVFIEGILEESYYVYD